MTTTAEPNVARAIETVQSHLHPTPSWDLADHEVPHGREEVWRFTPITRFQPLFDADADVGVLTWEFRDDEQVSVGPMNRDDARAIAVDPPVDRVALLGFDQAEESTLIDIPAGVELAEPIVFTGTGQGGQARHHIVVRVGENAQATVVFRYAGSASYAEKTDVIVGDGASLNLVTVQDWEADAVHGGQRSIRIGRDAHVKTVTASIGGSAIRISERARYDAPGGTLDQFGVYFVDADDHVEHRMFVDHNEPHTESYVDYRGALQGQGAHSVWIGDVLIRKNAQDIETYETNKNLVLTEGCQADSVPNLEIETGEIRGAGHASSTGRFDDEQLFYLMSRGIPEVEARRLVVHGFFYDIIRRIGVPEIEHRLMEVLERELQVITAVRNEDHA